jgi:serpin B
MEELSLEEGQRRHLRVVTSLNAFATDLYRRLIEQAGNLFFSPYSIHSLMQMLQHGASGRTAAQMAAVLHLTADGTQSLDDDFAIRQSCFGQTLSRQLAVANAVWVQRDYTIHSRFVEALRQRGFALEQVDFGQAADEICRQINDWVTRQTRGKITNMVGHLHPLTRLVLANAIYFKANWRNKFDPEETTKAPFQLADGRVTSAPMMRRRGTMNAAVAERYWVVELLYDLEQMSMLLLIPRQLGDLDWLEETILTEGPNAWERALQARDVDLSLPRFCFRSGFDISETLAAMGMVDAFDSALADFSGMASDPLLGVLQVLHQAYIEVNEAGTEAAAATVARVLTTGCGDGGSYPPLVIKADRPFIFAICHRPDGFAGTSVMFLGRVMCPAEMKEPVAPSGNATKFEAPPPDAPLSTGKALGRIVAFLTVNKFRVRLNDGSEVVAAMPDELLPVACVPREPNDGSFLAVEVEFRERPAVARIINARWEGI